MPKKVTGITPRDPTHCNVIYNNKKTIIFNITKNIYLNKTLNVYRLTTNYSISTRTWSSSTVSPTFMCTALTTPVTPLARLFCIFIASTTQHSWPSPTLSPTSTPTFLTTPGMGERIIRLVSIGTLIVGSDQYISR